MGTEATQRWAASREAKTGERVILTCEECGGKYRPAGGPCIHEHPTPALPACLVCGTRTLCAEHILRGGQYDGDDRTICGVCGVAWRPGHTCIPQPTESDVRQLAAMSRALRLVGDMIEELSARVAVARPESWEAV